MKTRIYVASVMATLLLLAGCGQSYEETKRISRAQRREAFVRDSMALKVAVMPTLDGLPLWVAQHYQLFDTLNGGVRLKHFTAQMDCDTALERRRVEGAVTDLVRVAAMGKRGTQLRTVATTNSYWQLIANRNARVRKLSQLDDKMVAMTRLSVTDLLCDVVVDSAKLRDEHLFRVQINDVNVRLLMLQNNEMDALFLTEPQATAARMGRNNVLLDTRRLDMRMGVVAFREKEMRRPERHKQLELFVKAYNQACDSINRYGVQHYRDLIVKHCDVKAAVADSLPRDLKFQHAVGPRQRDVERAEQWMSKR